MDGYTKYFIRRILAGAGAGLAGTIPLQTWIIFEYPQQWVYVASTLASAVIAFTAAAFNLLGGPFFLFPKKASELVQHLESRHSGKQLWAAIILQVFPDRMNDLQILTELEGEIRRVVEEQNKKLRPRDRGDLEFRKFHTELARALQEFGKRKAMLAKQQDGEMLTGETIKAPSCRAHSAYRIARRQIA